MGRGIGVIRGIPKYEAIAAVLGASRGTWLLIILISTLRISLRLLGPLGVAVSVGPAAPPLTLSSLRFEDDGEG